MKHLIVSWLLSAFGLWIVGQIIPGITLRGFGTALIATIVIAVVNWTVGLALKIISLPLILLTLGLFLLVVNALLLKLASLFVPGFEVRGFGAALIGSIVLTVLDWALRHVVF